LSLGPEIEKRFKETFGEVTNLLLDQCVTPARGLKGLFVELKKDIYKCGYHFIIIRSKVLVYAFCLLFILHIAS
jgi:hypothetical protein